MDLAKDPNVWIERYVVRSYELDPSARLQVASFLNFMQETAAADTLARGLSARDLSARTQAWVLSRLALEVHDRPGWRDEVLVRTWASGIDGRLLALRDFQFEDGEGRILAHCTTAWLYVDLASRRLLRVDQGLLEGYPTRHEHVLPAPPAKLPPLQDGGEEHDFAVRYRDVDVNQHVNNARYVEYVIASVPVELLEAGSLTALEINFTAEARLGDRVTVRCRRDDSEDELADADGAAALEHSVRRARDDQELVRARTRWRR